MLRNKFTDKVDKIIDIAVYALAVLTIVSMIYLLAHFSVSAKKSTMNILVKRLKFVIVYNNQYYFQPNCRIKFDERGFVSCLIKTEKGHWCCVKGEVYLISS